MGGLLLRAAAILAVGLVLGLVDRRAWTAKVRPDAPVGPIAVESGPRPAPGGPGSGAVPPSPTTPASTPTEPFRPAAGAAAPKPGEPGWMPTTKVALTGKPGHLTLAEALDLHTFQVATFLDARNRDEYAAGHIPGSHLAPLSAFREGRPPAVLATLAKDAPIVVYCGGGDCEASEDVQLILQSAGHVQVFILHDGFPGWRAAGYPVQTGGPEP
jgi:rhodanese-related sulfurtransferase